MQEIPSEKVTLQGGLELQVKFYLQLKTKEGYGRRLVLGNYLTKVNRVQFVMQNFLFVYFTFSRAGRFLGI